MGTEIQKENFYSRNACKESEAFEISELIFNPANHEA
jgi:hypothetical protein